MSPNTLTSLTCGPRPCFGESYPRVVRMLVLSTKQPPRKWCSEGYNDDHRLLVQSLTPGESDPMQEYPAQHRETWHLVHLLVFGEL